MALAQRLNDKCTLHFTKPSNNEIKVTLPVARYKTVVDTWTKLGIPAETQVDLPPTSWTKLNLEDTRWNGSHAPELFVSGHSTVDKTAYVVIPPAELKILSGGTDILPGIMLAVQIKGAPPDRYKLLLPKLKPENLKNAQTITKEQFVIPGANATQEFLYRFDTTKYKDPTAAGLRDALTTDGYTLTAVSAVYRDPSTISSSGGGAYGLGAWQFFLIKPEGDIKNGSITPTPKDSWEEAYTDLGGVMCYKVGDLIGIRRGSNLYFEGPDATSRKFTVKEYEPLKFEGVHYNSVSTVPSTTRCAIRTSVLEPGVTSNGAMGKLDNEYFRLSNPTGAPGYHMLLRLLYNNGEPIVSGSRANRMLDPVFVNVRGPHPGGIMTLCTLQDYVRWSPLALRAISMLQKQCQALHQCNTAATGAADVASETFSKMEFVLGPKSTDEAVVFAEALRACVIYGKTWDDGGRSFKDRSVVKRADQALARHVAAVVEIVSARQ